MKSSRFRYSYRKNASKLHKTVGDLLRGSSIFGTTEIYQEYPVNRVAKHYANARHHFDWVIPKLKLVFEVHGKPHYEVVAFDGDNDKATERFMDQKNRDKSKKQAAIEAGYLYIEIPYYKVSSLDEEALLEMIRVAKSEQEDLEIKSIETKNDKIKKIISQRNKEKRQKYLDSEAHKRHLERAREARKRYYKKIKDFKNEL